MRTTTEAEFNRQFMSMIGNIPLLLRSIGGAVLFAIFFAVLNTMLMAGRERTRDIGILKALGFRNSTISALLLVESLLLCLSGGLVGAGLAKMAERPLWSIVNSMIPGFSIYDSILLQGILLAATLGVLAGALPSLRASRLAPVTALRLDV